MNDKEVIEIAKRELVISTLAKSVGYVNLPYVIVTSLIKQAEMNEDVGVITSNLYRENKQYRQALQFYADKNKYNDRGDYWQIVNDEGNTARNALEGEE